MSFKDIVAKDCDNIFLNEAEFGETRTIWYDGDAFYDIPVLLTKIKQIGISVGSDNRMDGVHNATERLHVSLKSMRGIVPEQKRYLSIDDGYSVGRVYVKKYRIISSSVAMGMITLELEAYDE